ncbi:hypothetical protein FB192DRAFT_1443052 [Mucor lusitanicus]|uniref:F-box domain-containing protein n=2 Tax=Mucor circinelloides f. lusitanicus TaxID=29924 RepID=A0A162YW87_MUCCL|nr:hypothetical protein FB192DRAFT_1443052 [Mucor lusitanicus]OAD01047.1 hypothetical protein MUCCIDRAFT_112474 [Mucor lusitanicus CBS 277.49]
MKASDLPQEILQNIFYYLEEGPRYYIDDEEDLAKRSLLQLQLTCKLWSQVAREVFYQNIGHAVKELSFDNKLFNDNLRFAAIVILCPNLKVLLRWERSNADFYTPSLALYQLGFLQKLEKVSPPTKMGNYEAEIESYHNYLKLVFAARQTITSLQLSGGYKEKLAVILRKFINLKEIRFVPDSNIDLQQLSRLLQGSHPHLKVIDISSVVPTTDQHQEQQPLLHGLTENPLTEHFAMELCPLSIQDMQRIQFIFPKVSKLFLNRISALDEPYSGSSVVQEENLDMVFDQFFKYLSTIKQFYVGCVKLSCEELLAALAIVSKHLQVCRVSIEAGYRRHDFFIASAGHFERITIGHGEKPNCCIELKVHHSLINNAFCQDLYKTIARQTAPLDMVIAGTLEEILNPWNQYFGNHIGYLLAHCPSLIQLTVRHLSIDIPQLADTDNPSSVSTLNIIDSSVTPGTLENAARKLKFMSKIKIDNVQQVEYVLSDIRHRIMEINMPQASIESLIFYDHRIDYRTNVIFKIQLTAGTFYYYIDSGGWVTKLSRNAYLNRQTFTQRDYLEFTVHCNDLHRITTTYGTIEID